MKTATKQDKPATGSEIRKLLGPGTDEDLVSSILQTGASHQEVMEACEWLDDDDYMGAGLQRVIHSNVQSVYDILLEDRKRDGLD